MKLALSCAVHKKTMKWQACHIWHVCIKLHKKLASTATWRCCMVEYFHKLPILCTLFSLVLSVFIHSCGAAFDSTLGHTMFLCTYVHIVLYGVWYTNTGVALFICNLRLKTLTHLDWHHPAESNELPHAAAQDAECPPVCQQQVAPPYSVAYKANGTWQV